MKVPGVRLANLAGFLACAGLMAYALYAEHVLYLMPCPLCVFQRIAVIALGMVFLLAAIHNPGLSGRRVYALLAAAAAAAGIAVAGRHVWLQNLPPEEVPTCGPGFDFIMTTFPLSEALAMIFTGSGECADIDWQLLGLSMPAWVIIAVAALGAYALWNNLRRDPAGT